MTELREQPDAAEASTLPLGEGDGSAGRRAHLAPGACVGRFVVVRFVAEGGMGALYKAYDPELDREVALKLLRGDATTASATAARERLLREARALARLSHPNVVALYDAGTAFDQVFLAMEYVEGTTLRSWLKAERRSRAAILDVFLAAGEGLAAAHRAGLVHRDVKPDNVLLGDDGRVRVVDFGLARAADPVEGHPSAGSSPGAPPGLISSSGGSPSRRPLAPDGRSRPSSLAPRPLAPRSLAPAGPAPSSSSLGESALTLAGVVMGTPRYMAPEQHAAGNADARSDQFGFCVALYEALYGSAPFGEGTPAELAARARKGVLAAPPKSGVPRWLRRVLVRGLAADPKDRFPSMDALLVALRADPFRRARTWSARAAVALALGAAAAAAIARRPPPPVCAGGERALEGAWDSKVRAAVEQAFRASGAPFAEAALASVTRALDEHAARWTAQHKEACEATRVRGEQSEELLDRRMECLSRRLREVRALSSVLATATPLVVQNAVRAAQQLPSIDACADVASLRHGAPAPRDPAARARVDEVRTMLAHAQALRAAGRYADAREAATRALAAADAAPSPELRADARLTLGRALQELAEYQAAEAALRQAWIGAEAAGDERAMTEARVELVRVVGARLARYGEGEEWAQLAEAAVVRLDRADALRVQLYAYVAELRLRQGKLDDALAQARAGAELAARSLGPEHLGVAGAYKSIGAILYSQGHFADAEQATARALALSERALGPQHPDVADLLANLGDLAGEQGRHGEALRQYERALRVLEDAVGGEHPHVARLLNNMGDDLRAVGQLARAHECYARALSIWEKRLGPEHPLVAVALHNLAEERLEAGQPAEARPLLERALAVRLKAHGPDHPDVAADRAVLGDVLFALGRLDEALAAYRAAQGTWEKSDGGAHPEAARALVGQGRVHLARHVAVLGLGVLEQAVRFLETSEGDARKLADARFVLAQALRQAQGDPDRARDLAERALATYRDGGERMAAARDAVQVWLRAGP